MNRLRLAKYDNTGEPLFDTDVLTDWELAEDLGWLPRSREHVVIDPASVALVADLQRRADGAA